MEITSIKEACQAIMKECNNSYAKTYANAILTGEVHARVMRKQVPMSLDDALKDQANYILSNINGWRGDTAKAVRKFLKEYVGD